MKGECRHERDQAAQERALAFRRDGCTEGRTAAFCELGCVLAANGGKVDVRARDE
jgi:hypothetical protein